MGAFDDDVDTIGAVGGAYFVLTNDLLVAVFLELFDDSFFEVTFGVFERVGSVRVRVGEVEGACVAAVADEVRAIVGAGEILGVEGVDNPHLVLGARGCDVDAA